MGKWIVEGTVKQMIAANRVVKGSTVNILGFAFKENCADVRNSKVNDIVVESRVYGVNVHAPCRSGVGRHALPVRIDPLGPAACCRRDDHGCGA